MLASVEVEHEVHQRSLQPRPQVPIDCEARSRNLRRALQIEHAELFAKLPVRLGREVEFRRGAPAAYLGVVCLALAHRNAVIGQVGNVGQKIAQLGIACGNALVCLGNLLLQPFLFLEVGGGVLLLLFKSLELPDQLVTPRLHGFRFGDGGAPLGVDLLKTLEDGGVHAALAQLFFHQRQMIAYKR